VTSTVVIVVVLLLLLFLQANCLQKAHRRMLLHRLLPLWACHCPGAAVRPCLAAAAAAAAAMQ
jgi:hypothetical protein